MNLLFMGFVVWWSYNSFGLMGVLGFPMISEAQQPPALSASVPITAAAPPPASVELKLLAEPHRAHVGVRARARACVSQ